MRIDARRHSCKDDYTEWNMLTNATCTTRNVLSELGHDLFKVPTDFSCQWIIEFKVLKFDWLWFILSNEWRWQNQLTHFFLSVFPFKNLLNTNSIKSKTKRGMLKLALQICGGKESWVKNFSCSSNAIRIRLFTHNLAYVRQSTMQRWDLFSAFPISIERARYTVSGFMAVSFFFFFLLSFSRDFCQWLW